MTIHGDPHSGRIPRQVVAGLDTQTGPRLGGPDELDDGADIGQRSAARLPFSVHRG